MAVSYSEVDKLLDAALLAIAQKRPADAFNALKRAEQLDPGNAKVLYLRGVVHMQTGALDKALDLMRRSVLIDPNLYVAHFHIGFLLFNEDREEEAEKAWRELERLGNDNPLVLFTNGVQAWSRDEFDDAKKYINRGLELNSSNGLFDAEMRQILAWIDEEEDS